MGRRRWPLAPLIACAVLLCAAPVALARQPFSWPVPGAVVHGFEGPARPWMPGHRGVDLAVAAGDEVRAMADGTVSFAGIVVGRTWVTVAHAGGIRTTYGPMATLAVAMGGKVGRADPVGTAEGEMHGEAVLHVSARVGNTYVDPVTLFDPPPRVPTLVGPGELAADTPEFGPRLILVEGLPASPRHLVVVSGLGSGTGDLGDMARGLGYDDGEWSQFSYTGLDASGDPLPFDSEATWGTVHESALQLREQLRAYAAQNPGKAVDLVGHSLGGLIATYYTLVLHDPADPDLPAIGTLATIASPVAGTSAASLVQDLRSHLVANLGLEAAQATVAAGMDDDAPVIDDLTPSSPAVRAILEAWERVRNDPYGSTVAAGTDMVSIGALADPVVPAHRSYLPGVPHVTVASWHGSAPDDPLTGDVLWSTLSGREGPGLGMLDRAVDALGAATPLISLVEDGIGMAVSTLLPWPGNIRSLWTSAGLPGYPW